MKSAKVKEKVKVIFSNLKGVYERLVYNEVVVENMQSTMSQERVLYSFSWKSLEGILSLVFTLFMTLAVILKQAGVSSSTFNSLGDLGLYFKQIFTISKGIFFVVIFWILMWITITKPFRFYKTICTFILSKTVAIIIILYLIANSVLKKSGYTLPNDYSVLVVILILFQIYMKPWYRTLNVRNTEYNKRRLIVGEKIASHVLITVTVSVLFLELVLFCLGFGNSSVVRIEGVILIVILSLLPILLLIEGLFIKRLINTLATFVLLFLFMIALPSGFQNNGILDFYLVILEISISLVLVYCIEYRAINEKLSECSGIIKSKGINIVSMLLIGSISIFVAPILFVYLKDGESYFLLGTYLTLLFLLIRNDENPVQRFFLLVTLFLVLIVFRSYIINNSFVQADGIRVVYIVEITVGMNVLGITYYLKMYFKDEIYKVYFDEIFLKDKKINKSYDCFSKKEKVRVISLLKNEDFNEIIHKYEIEEDACEKALKEYYRLHYYNIFKFGLKNLNYSNEKLKKIFKEFEEIKTDISIKKSVYFIFPMQLQKFYHIDNYKILEIVDTGEIESFVEKLLSFEKKSSYLHKMKDRIIKELSGLKIIIQKEK